MFHYGNSLNYPSNYYNRMNQKVKIERVTDKNFDEFLLLIKQLAIYEKNDPPDEQGKARLRRDALSKNPLFEAYLGRMDGDAIAYMILYMTYSSYLALPTLYLEDLFVVEEWREKRIGRRMFEFCVQQAKERKCGRMEWCVFNWNKSAIEFYKKNDATRLNKTYYRLDKNQIERLLKN